MTWLVMECVLARQMDSGLEQNQTACVSSLLMLAYTSVDTKHTVTFFSLVIDCGNLTDPEGGQIMFTPGVVATTDSGLDAVATYSCNRVTTWLVMKCVLAKQMDSGMEQHQTAYVSDFVL